MSRRNSTSPETWRPTFGGGVAPVVAIVVGLATWLAISNSLLNELLGSDPPPIPKALLGMVSSSVQVTILAVVLRYEGIGLGDLLPSRDRLVPAIAAGVGVLVAVNAYVTGRVSLGGGELSVGFFALYTSAPLDYSVAEVLVSVFYYVCFVGVVEELVFRGYLQNKLIASLDGFDARLARVLGIVAASVVFALAHVPAVLLGGGASLGATVGFLLLNALSGLTFGVIYELTGNLYLVALLHGFGDFWPLFVDPGPVAWPNFLVLVSLYAVLVVAYRRWPTDGIRPNALTESAD